MIYRSVSFNIFFLFEDETPTICNDLHKYATKHGQHFRAIILWQSSQEENFIHDLASASGSSAKRYSSKSEILIAINCIGENNSIAIEGFQTVHKTEQTRLGNI